jgi:hypothetical protein
MNQQSQHPLTEFMLPLSQRQIVSRAANTIQKANRPAFMKFVNDVLRARRDPPSDVDVRHACGAGICRYGRRL